MKIALVSILFNRKGGSERRTYQLAAGLLGLGHEVSIFANEVEDMALDAEVNIVPAMPAPTFLRVLTFTKNLNAALAKRTDIDIIHNQIRPFNDWIVTVGGGCHAEYLEKMAGRRFPFNPRDLVILDMEKRQYREGGCRAVITNSALSKKGILKHYPIPPKRVHVAYNGVDTEKFSPTSVLGNRAITRKKYGFFDEPVALFLGSGFERKGLEAAIRALRLVKEMDGAIRHLKLLIVGRDRQEPWLKLAARLGVSDMVVFAGQTAKPEDFYAAADIFVLPTKFDPFSNATLEAMSCGLPVITTAENGVSEIILDGENGFVMQRPDDYMGLASTLGYLGCEKARRETGENARITAEGFTWNETLSKTLDVYNSVLYKRGF